MEHRPLADGRATISHPAAQPVSSTAGRPKAGGKLAMAGYSGRNTARGRADNHEFCRHCIGRLPGRGDRPGFAGAWTVLRPPASDGNRPQRTAERAFCYVSQRRQRQCSRIRRHPPAHRDPSGGAGRAGVVRLVRAAPRQRPGVAARDGARRGNRVPDRQRDLPGALPARVAHHLDLRRVRCGRSRRQAVAAGPAAKSGLSAMPRHNRLG